MDYLGKKRIESAFYYPGSKPETRAGISSYLFVEVGASNNEIIA